MSTDAPPHPFLDDAFHVRWSTLSPDQIKADITGALESSAENLDTLAGLDRGKIDWEDLFVGLENATEGLSRAWGLVTHLDAVCNSDDLREAHNEMLPKVTEFMTNIYLDEGLWDLLKTYANTPEAAEVEGVRKRFTEETMEDFRESGADLNDADKAKLQELSKALAETTQKFSENVLDSTNAWDMVIEDESKLAGLPESAVRAARQSAEDKGLCEGGKDAWRFTLQAPSCFPLLEHLDDEEIRREVWEATCTVGRDGDYDNTDNIFEILRLRQEKADLFETQHFADRVLKRRMAKDGATALGFVEDLHRRIRTAFDRECTTLQQYRAHRLNVAPEPLEPWGVAYWAEKQRKELFDFDDEELRPYFPIDQVLGGMFEIAQRSFDIRIKERETVFYELGETGPSAAEVDDEGQVEVWHPEVKFYEIRTPDDVHLGSFYADWHPRESKRGGAWMNYLRTGRPPTEEEDREPHLGLICGNMTPSVGDRPALLKHDEVETVFHEFGHLLHHLLGDVEVKSLNGVNVAWDFVELPSQIMENFCWDRETLDLFARHHETGETIPPKLFKRMTAARNYMSATANMRQLQFGKMDLEMHMHHADAGAEGADLDDLCREITEGYRSPLKTEPPSMLRRFTHLFASPTGYASGYYSYKWAKVLDADCFTRFQKEGVLNPKVGREFRDKILSKGNSAEPDALFRDFMGRDPDLTALLVRSGLA